MAYADYKYYTENYYGNLISSESEFDRVQLWASNYIDRVTCGRAEEEGTSDEVKRCSCALADAFYELRGRGGIVSENNDGYSVSYESAGADTARRLYTIARMFLPEGMLYRGEEMQ